ncbi:MAG: hypothetical protein HY543_02285 [Deltaproteobacteria bacterium]|nr:hypothetical protein [Deltaproteobacteria bacterium]
MGQSFNPRVFNSQVFDSQVFDSQTFDSQAFNSQALRAVSAAINSNRMADRIMQYAPASDAEALNLFRRSFPGCPLSMRVAVLDFLIRRRAGRPAA